MLRTKFFGRSDLEESIYTEKPKSVCVNLDAKIVEIYTDTFKKFCLFNNRTV